jgi:hypothetical protein
MRRVLYCLPFCAAMLCGPAGMQAAAAGCTGPNGSRFNLEPRLNAVVQSARSVAFLPNRAGPGIDLVFASGTDNRSLAGSPDAFYAQRSNANCVPDFEGGPPSISNVFDLFVPSGSSTVIADPARDQFFMVDLRFGLTTDENGVGILRTTAAKLLSPTDCPSGTQPASASCISVGAVSNITELNAFLDNPHIAVDPRTSGTGAGDVYTVVGQRASGQNSHHISLTACTNGALNCSNSISLSGADTTADFPYIQVRPDGLITVSYVDANFSATQPDDIKFVTCTPSGAPQPPTCNAPVVVTTEMQPVLGEIGELPVTDVPYPRHVNRLESDGHTITTFLVYDRCDVPPIAQHGAGQAYCPKNDVGITHSSDGGQTWSAVSNVTSSAGQQFFSAIALDASTETVSIAYYSTENDFFKLKPQVFLAQIAPGSTAVGPPQRLTTGAADVRAGPPIMNSSLTVQTTSFGDRLGLAAAGSGTLGASRAYVGFTWNTVPGVYGGVASADVNNHLTLFAY